MDLWQIFAKCHKVLALQKAFNISYLLTCGFAALVYFCFRWGFFCRTAFLLMKHLWHESHQLLQPHQLLLHLYLLLKEEKTKQSRTSYNKEEVRHFRKIRRGDQRKRKDAMKHWLNKIKGHKLVAHLVACTDVWKQKQLSISEDGPTLRGG